MDQNRWNEEKIENLLSNVPEIHDTRSKNEVFLRLKQEGLFDEAPIPTKKKVHWLPYLISTCAVIICIILLPSLLKNLKENTTENVLSTASDKSVEEKPEIQQSSTKTLVYEEDLQTNVLFSIGLVSPDADSVPVSILIPKDKIQQDFGKLNPSNLELYEKYASQLDEVALGFEEYHPYVGSLKEEGKIIIHTLPAKQNYDMASASLMAYEASLIDTFPNYEEIEFIDEAGNPYIFNEIGVSKTLKVKDELTQYNYFLYQLPNGNEYLIPNFRMAYPSVEEAINAMKEETNDIYKSVILEGVDYTCRDEGATAIVKFSSQVDLTNYDQAKAMKMIEGILLTASEFNKQVKFENIKQTNWEGLNFTEPLPIPVGPNKIENPIN